MVDPYEEGERITLRDSLRYIDCLYAALDTLDAFEGLALVGANQREATREALRIRSEKRRAARADREREARKIAVTVDELSEMISVGKNNARKIGKRAGAEIWLTGHAVLYNVAKVEAYINEKSGTGEDLLD